MSDQPLSGTPAPEVVQAGLRELAHLLREAPPLPAKSQPALAALLGEMADALSAATLSADGLDRLADHAHQFASALRSPNTEAPHPHSAGERVEAALLGLAARAPFATGTVRRFLEALAGIGI